MDVMRISGMASGMDTETMVRDLMRAERIRVDKYNQQKQLALWRQEQYNTVNKDFANFILDTRKELELMKSNSYGSSFANSKESFKWVKKATSSDEDIFTAQALAGAPTGTHTIKIEKLAKGVNAASTTAVKDKDGNDATKSTTMADMGVAAGSVTFQIKVNEVDTETIEISYTQDDTIGDLVTKINDAVANDTAKTPLGIQASFDDTTGRLFLSTKGTGATAQIKVTQDTQSLFTGTNVGENKFHMQIADGTDLLTGKTGQDAEISFNGAQGLKYDSNTFTLNGIQIDLKAIPADTTKEYTIKVDTDVNGVYDKIKSFVDKYNELVEKMNKKISEKRYRDFQPLTAEQKEAMSEEDIKKWEEKAQSGLLRNDEFVGEILQSVRSGLYEKVEGISGPYNQLHTIGITTGEWKDKGKLVISEEKLKKAIENDVDGVMDLLFSPSNNEDRSKSGLVNRLYDDITEGMKQIIDKSGTGDNAELYRSVKSNILIDFVTGGNGRKGSISLLDEDVFGFEKRIMEEERRLAGIEEGYWRKFTAMEKALSQMNSQSAWLAGQLGGM
ncbi:flagellar filament capping protein FliD [Clostridiaceae bacterium 35-E11]